jgi:hypothetical protein
MIASRGDRYVASLNEYPMSARLAATDIGRARAWCSGKLGLTPEKEEMGGMALWYRCSATWFLLYQTDTAGTARMKTVDGILSVPPGYKSAWFIDSEGNTLELTEAPAA